MSILATIDDRNQWSDGHKLHAAGTLAFAGSYVAGGVAVDLGLAGFRSGAIPCWFEVPPFHGYTFEYVPGTDFSDGKLIVRGNGSSAAAVSTLTSNNTNVATAVTVTIGTTVYTFRTSLTDPTTAYEVLIGADADASLLNLIRAINGSGTPGTDYGSLTVAHPDVSAATSVTAHAFEITARVAGADGNLIATLAPDATLDWTSTVMASGVSSTPIGTQLLAGAFATDLTALDVPFYVISDQFV